MPAAVDLQARDTAALGWRRSPGLSKNPRVRVLASRFAVLMLLVAPFAEGCSTTPTSPALAPPPTSVSVSPGDFMSPELCTSAPGGMRSFVATLTDLSLPDGPFTLPSSPPTDCASFVSFRFVSPTHRYTAEIDGYEQAPDAIIPVGGRWSGAREMHELVIEPPDGGAGDGGDAGSDAGVVTVGPVITPRWTTRCVQAVTASFEEDIPITDCEPLEDHEAGPTPTGIQIAFASALPNGICDGIASLDVLPDDFALPPVSDVDCATGNVTYKTGITAARTYGFTLRARAIEGGPVTLGGRCSAMATDGLVVAATCDTLTSAGEIRFNPSALLAAKKVACAPGITYLVKLRKPGGADVLASSPPVACGDDVQMGPVAAFDASGALIQYTADLTVSSSSTLITATCTATVSPGETTNASCH
jgi:hypothetical protein